MRKRTATFRLAERLGVSWPRTLCHFDVASRGLDPALTRSATVNGESVPFQTSPERGTVGVFLALPAWSRATVAFTTTGGAGANAPRPSRPPQPLWLGPALLPPLGTTRFDPPADSLSVPAPIRRLRTPDGREIGHGWLDTYERVVSLDCAIVEAGPLWTTARVRYTFDSGAVFTFEATAAEGEDFLCVREEAWLGPKARWVFALDAPSGLLPDGLDLADHTLHHTPRALHYLSDRLHARLHPWTQGTQISALREGFVAHSSATGDAIGWFARTDPEWDGFKGTFLELRERRLLPGTPRSRGGETDGDSFTYLPPDYPRPADSTAVPALCAEAFLTGGIRAYGLFVGDRSAWHCPDPVPEHDLEWYRGPARLAEWSAIRSPLRALLQQQGLLSLDIAKDWILALPGHAAPATAGAAGGSGGLPPALCPADYPEDLRPLLADLRANAATLCRAMRDDLAVLAGGYVAARGPGGTNPVTLRCAFPYARLFAELLRLGAVPRRLPDDPAGIPPLRDRLAASLLFLAHLCARRSFYPGEFTMLPMADPRSSEPTCLGMPNMNFLTDVYVCSGGIATVFPDHPAAPSWLARANRLLGLQLDVFSDPRSGSWEESHTYFNHVLRTLGPFALAQQALAAPAPAGASGGSGGQPPVPCDWFADPRFIRLCRAALAFVTPRDPNVGNRRMMATLGDHRAELGWHTGDLLARGFAAHRATRRLARHLAWLSQENGWEGTPAVPPLRPPLASLQLDGLGAVLRSPGGSGGPPPGHVAESMLLLRAGYQWGHHNNDELEVLFWAFGEPVLSEAGYGNPKTFAKIGPSGHSVLHPRDFDPAFYLSRATRGRITEFSPGVLAGERLVAFRHPPAGVLEPVPLDEPYRQTRRLEWNVFADGTSFLRVIDRWEGAHPQRLQFHTGGLAVEPLGSGRCRIRGHRLDTLVECSIPLVWEIVPDACGFTIGFGADIPADVHDVSTIFQTRSVSVQRQGGDVVLSLDAAPMSLHAFRIGGR